MIFVKAFKKLLDCNSAIFLSFVFLFFETRRDVTSYVCMSQQQQKTLMNFGRNMNTITSFQHMCKPRVTVDVFWIGFHEAPREGIMFPPYNCCYISGTWRATNFKLCIASYIYLSHIQARFGGYSSIGDVRVTSQSCIVSRNHAFSGVT